MSIATELKTAGCVYERQPNSTHFVSYWHVPGGYDYAFAQARKMYFSKDVTEKVQTVVRQYDHPPEMAFVGEL